MNQTTSDIREAAAHVLTELEHRKLTFPEREETLTLAMVFLRADAQRQKKSKDQSH